MCGIAGVARFADDVDECDRSIVERMMAAEQHRGPDSAGIRISGKAVLGHRRLSIIDVREIAGQPMPNETRDVWVAFNGEIYNHRELRAELAAAGHDFESECDTEVLVHGYEQWGGQGLYQRLRGMFAFAIQDERKHSDVCAPCVFAARDRLGIKPLYYTVAEGRVSFASEVKALIRAGAAECRPDRGALAAFLSLGSIPFPGTWIKGVQCLPPGHSLEVSRGGVSVRKEWDLRYFPQRHDGGAEASIGCLFQDSIARHLRADVPVGVFLSGGADSAVVTCAAARNCTHPLRTLTIAFDQPEFDEGESARQIADAFGAEHEEIRVTNADFETAIPQFLESMDQPTSDGVNTWFVSRAAAAAGLKVVLSGLGGDEIFFGYPHYRALVSGTGALGGFVRSSDLVRRMVSWGGSAYGRIGGAEKWRRFDHFNGSPTAESLYLLIRGFFPPRDVARLLGMGSKEVKSALEETFGAIRMRGDNGHSDANRFHYLEMKRYLHDQLLRDADVFSMTHSIELRVPLLDDPLVEAGCRIPPREKVSSTVNKPKLVDAIGDPVVRSAAMRPKRGFVFPFAAWMKANAAGFEERALSGNLLERAAVRDCWRQFRAGRLHWSRAWSTVVLAALANGPLRTRGT